MNIFASKQVGKLSYFVKDLAVLYNIIDEQRIKQSNNPEVNPRSGRKEFYVSFSRDMTAAAIRNNKRWKYGIVVDGDRLSEHYHIEPFSFTGDALNNGKDLRIKYLVSYDDNTYALNLVNWPTIQIDKSSYEAIKNMILSQSEKFNNEHKLVYQDEGKVRRNGHMIVEKFTYNVKHGDSGQLLSSHEVPGSVKTQLMKGQSTNEYEERVWADKYPFIDISGCIKGIILPKNELSDFETSELPLVTKIREVLDETCNNYDIIFY